MWMTFDLDGVVMETPLNFGVLPHVLQILVRNHMATEAGRGKDWEILYSELWLKLREEHKRRYALANSYTAYDWDSIVAGLAKEYGCCEEINLPELLNLYCIEPYVKSHEEAHEILQQIKAAGWQIGVITNGYRKYQAPVLEALKLMPLLDILITPEEIKVVKPEQEIFAQVPGIRDGVWIHVGDTLVHDIYGSKRAGAKTVWFDRYLPEELKKLAPAERVETLAGEILLKAVWEKENSRYPNLCLQWEDCRPDWIIYHLAELTDLGKELRI